MARNDLLRADIPLRNYSLTHSLTHSPVCIQFKRERSRTQRRGDVTDDLLRIHHMPIDSLDFT